MIRAVAMETGDIAVPYHGILSPVGTPEQRLGERGPPVPPPGE